MIKISKDKKTLVYNGETINIEKYIGKDNTDGLFESIYTSKIRTYEKFAYLPIILNGKFRWLRKVEIISKLYFARICSVSEEFATYTNAWQKCI